MNRDELAAQMMAGLLARDPLPPLRFTDIGKRIVILWDLAYAIADSQPGAAQASMQEREARWTREAQEVREAETPEKLQGLGRAERKFDGKQSAEGELFK